MKQILKCSLFAIWLGSCSPSYKLPAEYQSVATNKTIIANPHVRVGEEYLYRTTITAYGHTFSGLLAAKITADNTWRVALTTDFKKLLQTHFTVIQKYTDGTTEVQKCKEGSDTIYLFTLESNLFKQLNMQGEKLYTSYIYNSNNITIEHHNLTIKIVLEPLVNF